MLSVNSEISIGKKRKREDRSSDEDFLEAKLEINKQIADIQTENSKKQINNKNNGMSYLNNESEIGIFFNPSKENYDPIKDACWKYDERYIEVNLELYYAL